VSYLTELAKEREQANDAEGAKALYAEVHSFDYFWQKSSQPHIYSCKFITAVETNFKVVNIEN
jgi:hypothetical protein